jgi:hypothetical protein
MSQLSILDDLADAAGGQLGSGFPAVFGPGSITLDFLVRTQGGFSVDGVDGAISGGSGTPPPHGFRVNGQPAVPGTNFLVRYGPLPPTPPVPSAPPAPPAPSESPAPTEPATAPPPAFDSQVVSSLTNVTEDVVPETEAAAPTKEEQARRRRRDREC